MRIEAVVACVGYADFLAETIDRTLRAVDQLVVVTTPDDDATNALCSGRDRVGVVQTNAIYADGAKFDLAAGINAGLFACRRDDWVLVLDADIALPHHARDAIEGARLDPRKLYGIDRVMAVGRDQWEAVRDVRQYRDHLVLPPALRLGVRVRLPFFGGYVPPGYFQLWNPIGSGIYDFAVGSKGTAEESDMLQAIRWEREDRELLPEIVGIHLESAGANGIAGANWAGRTTAAF